MPRTPRYWNPEEDEILRRGIDDCGRWVFPSAICLTPTDHRGVAVDWCAIAAQLPGRTNKDCRKRWHNAVTACINKGQWTKAEDELLKQGVSDFGQK
jgi:Myb-like DNA-binding domain